MVMLTVVIIISMELGRKRKRENRFPVWNTENYLVEIHLYNSYSSEYKRNKNVSI